MPVVKGYLGKDMLLKVESATTPGTYTVIGGMRTNDVNIKPGYLETTTKDGSRWKSQIEGGIRSASFSGAGVFINETQQKRVTALAVAGTIANWQLVAPNGDLFQGAFAITDWKSSGGHDGIQDFSFSLESAGDLTFTPGAV
jgi:TP901-1 family phage major tail protein